MKSNKFVAVALLFAITLVGGVIFYQKQVIAATTTVSATVNTSVTCTAATSTTAFGTLSSGSINTSTPTATTTLSCNYGGGCNLLVGDAGSGASPGLYAASATGTPLIASADALPLTVGNEGYGIQAATTSAGTGQALGVNLKYLVTGNNVGGLVLNTGAISIASSTLPVSGKEVVVTHKATISGLTKAGTYADTITYSCVGQ